jgi:hypothetical protein
VVKLPITSGSVAALEWQLSETKLMRRYSVGANVAWVEIPTEFDISIDLKNTLSAGQRFLVSKDSRCAIDGLVFNRPIGSFGRAIKRALDPDAKFG